VLKPVVFQRVSVGEMPKSYQKSIDETYSVHKGSLALTRKYKALAAMSGDKLSGCNEILYNMALGTGKADEWNTRVQVREMRLGQKQWTPKRTHKPHATHKADHGACAKTP